MNAVSGKRAVVVLLIVFLLAVSIGGAFVLCTMSPLEHLTEWQQTFAATVQQASTALFVLLFVLVSFRAFLQNLLFVKRAGIPVWRYRTAGRVFDPLRLAFARGILHSKAY